MAASMKSVHLCARVRTMRVFNVTGRVVPCEFVSMR